MKKNVASQIIGAQMVSAADGSAFTSATTVYVTGDGGAQAVGSVGAGACTHEGNGFHTYAPAQAETNYDHIGYTFIGTGAVPATVQVYTMFPQTGDNFARLGAPAGASVSADVAAVKAVLPAALVSGRIDASVGAMAANVLTAAAIASDAITDAKVASDVTIASVTGAVGSVTGAVGSVTGLTASDVGAIKTKTDFLPSATAGSAGGVFIAGSNAATSITTALTANIVGNVTGNLSGSVGSVTGAVGSVTGLTASDVGAIKTKTDFLPSATAGAAGGLMIAGANAATTVNITGNITGNLSGSVGSVTGAVGSVTGLTVANLDVAVSTRASQTSVDDLPTNAELATALGTADDAVLAILGTPAGASLAADIATRASQTSVDDLPTNAELATALAAADDAVLAQVALVKAKTDNLPADPADASDIAAATTAIAGYIDTEVGAIKAVTDKLDDTLEDAGTDGFIFSAIALSQAPTGGTAPTVGQIADEVQTRTIAAVTVVNGLAANTITAAATAADFTTEIQTGLATSAALSTVQASATDIQGRLPAALVSGRIDASVGAMAAGVLTATAIAADAITDAKVAADVTIASVTGSVGSVTGLTAADVGAIKLVTDKLDDTLEDAGTDGFIFSAIALSQAPGAGSAPTAVEIADEVETRTIAAVTVVNGLAANVITAAATAADFTTEIQAGLATAAAVADLPTNAELATALGTADDAVLSAIGALSVPTAVQIADAYLDRDMSLGVDSGSPTVRTPRQALRMLRNKWSISGSTQTITKEDDSTASWTQVLTATAGADPITGTDPAGP